MAKPRNPAVSPPDEDPTGVRALLSSLPAPDPMPDHLVRRISASLAAEQAERAAAAPDTSNDSVTPLRDTTRRRRGRLVFAMAGAAAAVALVTVVGNNAFNAGSADTSASLATAEGTPSARGGTAASIPGTDGYSMAAPTTASDEAPVDPRDASAARPPGILPSFQTRVSETRYTRAGFVSQTQALRGAAAGLSKTTGSRVIGEASAPAWLKECLTAIGAGGAQVVRSDVAFYAGQPAVIIVATTDGVSWAYAVGRQCSTENAAILRPATRLP